MIRSFTNAARLVKAPVMAYTYRPNFVLDMTNQIRDRAEFPLPCQLPLRETWHGYPLKRLYQKEFGCPVLVDNDVNVMALGEGYMGCTQDESNFLFIKAGTGIGAGDIGHIAVDGSSGEVSFYRYPGYRTDRKR